MQSENPCFGTKSGVIKKNLSNLRLCLVPVTFSSTSPFKLAQKLLSACAGWWAGRQVGSGLLTLLQQ